MSMPTITIFKGTPDEREVHVSKELKADFLAGKVTGQDIDTLEKQMLSNTQLPGAQTSPLETTLTELAQAVASALRMAQLNNMKVLDASKSTVLFDMNTIPTATKMDLDAQLTGFLAEIDKVYNKLKALS